MYGQELKLPVRILNAITSTEEYTDHKDLGNEKAISRVVTMCLHRLFDDFEDIYKKDSMLKTIGIKPVDISDSRDVDTARWLRAIYDNKGRGAETLYKFVGVAVEYTLLGRANVEVKPPEETMIGTYGIPIGVYNRFQDFEKWKRPFNDILAEAIHLMFSNFIALSENSTYRTFTYYVDERFLSHVEDLKGRNSKVPDMWLTFALQNYWLVNQTTKQHR